MAVPGITTVVDGGADKMSDDLKPIVEALIFASPDPLTPKTLFQLLESEPKEDVELSLIHI